MNEFIHYQKKSNAQFTFMTLTIVLSVILLVLASISSFFSANVTWFFIFFITLSFLAEQYMKRKNLGDVTRSVSLMVCKLTPEEFKEQLDLFINEKVDEFHKNRVRIELEEIYDKARRKK